MKKYIKIISLIFMISLIFSTHYSCFAKSTTHNSSSGQEHGGVGGSFGGSSKGSTTHNSSSGQEHGGVGGSFDNSSQKSTKEVSDSKKSDDENIYTDITGDNFIEDLKPDNLSGAAENLSSPFVKLIHDVVNPILGVVQVIGGILTVISVAMFGLGMLLSGNDHLAGDLGLRMMGGPGGKGGPEAKLELLNFGRTLLIGAVLLFCSATIVKFVFYIFNI